MKRSAMGALALVVVLAAGCAGGGGVKSPAPAPSSSSSGSSGTSSKATGKATFTIRIPAKSTASATKRTPKYVSPATNSISFSVGGSTPLVVPLTLGSASCPLASGFYTCTAQAYLPAGTNESLQVATYASTDGSGSPLATNTLPETITAGQTNDIPVTLNGVVNSLALNYSGTAFAVGTSSSVTATLVAKDASGNTIVGPGSLVDVNGVAIAPTLADSDTSTHTTVTTNGAGTTGISYTIAYDGTQIPSPTITVSGTSSFTIAAQQLRVDSAVVDGDFTIAPTAGNSVGSPWYTCSVEHAGYAAANNPMPATIPSPVAQASAPASPIPFPSASPTPVVSRAGTLPNGVANSVSGSYANFAEIEQAPLPAVTPNSTAGADGICQDVTIPSGTPNLHLQVLEGGDDNFANTDTEADLYTTPAGAPHSDGTLITTTRLASFFAEDNCWDAAGWEPIFLPAPFGSGSATLNASSRAAACPETPGGTAPFTGSVVGMGGYWYTRTIAIPGAQTGGTYTLYLGVWRKASSGYSFISSSNAAYYSFAFFTGVSIY